MKNMILLSIIFSISQSFADLTTIGKCVNEKYLKLTDNRSIAFAIVDKDNTQIFLYNQAKKDQLFEIGSITKTFTATLLSKEVADGKMNLNDPIPSEYQKTDAPITYQHLTTHTSGIISGNFPTYKSPNPESPYEGLYIPIFKDLYNKTSLAFPVGTQWKYSNIASGLLGLIIGENNNTSYNDLVIDKIFKPLGMKDSYFKVPEDQMARFPQGNVNGQIWPHWDLYDTAISPAGAIRSTVSDMALYARANLIPNSTLLQTAIENAHKPLYEIGKGVWIGMNWILEPSKNLIWHNGSTVGFKSILAISTKHHVAIVALTDTGIYKTDSSGTDSEDDSLQEIVFNCLK